MSILTITNAKVILPESILSSATVIIKDKKIVALRRTKSNPRGTNVINARGCFLSPGFIDLHIHGEVDVISKEQAKGGTTGFLSTLHPDSLGALLRTIKEVRAQGRVLSGAKMLGIRLEGPFINRSYCGALKSSVFRKPTLEETKKILAAAGNTLKMVVLAPELDGAQRVISYLRRHKVVSSLGHTGASFIQAKKAIDLGVRHATHTFNRMKEFDHREPGALGAVLTDQRVMCEVICDGKHVHPGALLMLARLKGSDKLTLVTDSTSAQVDPPKKRYGDIFRLKNGTMYGSALTLSKAIRNAIKYMDVPLVDAVRFASLNPAKTIGIEKRKGSIAKDKDADLVLLDSRLRVMMTMCEGKIVYRRVRSR